MVIIHLVIDKFKVSVQVCRIIRGIRESWARFSRDLIVSPRIKPDSQIDGLIADVKRNHRRRDDVLITIYTARLRFVIRQNYALAVAIYICMLRQKRGEEAAHKLYEEIRKTRTITERGREKTGIVFSNAQDWWSRKKNARGRISKVERQRER